MIRKILLNSTRRTMDRECRTGGFTLLELVVVMVVLGLVMLILLQILLTAQRSKEINSQLEDAGQNARVALELLSSDLRMAGSNIDFTAGQQAFVVAQPYQILFNADVDPGVFDPMNLNPPEAMDVSASPNKVPASGSVLYAPPRTYRTGAETIWITLDSNNDGVVDASDHGDDSYEDQANPTLYALHRSVYGLLADGTNGGASTVAVLLRGPDAYPDGTYPPPLFSYWYDHDDLGSTPDRLWGDADNSGELEDGERATLAAVADSALHLIRRVEINVVGGSQHKDTRMSSNDGFREVALSSQVEVRNTPPSNAARIYGTVFTDLNQNGTRNPGETGIPDVPLQLNTGARAKTNNSGVYTFLVTSGIYTVQEVDPAGYISSTANLVNATVKPGELKRVDFGDYPAAGFGIIKGVAYSDVNSNGKFENPDSLMGGIQISLNSGEVAYTDSSGAYSFVVLLNSYAVSVQPPVSWIPSSPGTVPVSLTASGDSVIVNFGMVRATATGTIEGYVYHDADNDQVKDADESGIADVYIHTDMGDTVVTDVLGFYRLSLPAGIYSVSEIDPLGYSSSTTNTYANVTVTQDTVITLDFGDVADSDLEFTEIVLGETDKVLSITSTDLGEDNKHSDPDLIVGSTFNGTTENIMVFWNAWVNSSTPPTSIFPSTPSYGRNAPYNVQAVTHGLLDADGTNDITTGLDYDAGNNMELWYTLTTPKKYWGVLPTSASQTYSTAGVTRVMDVVVADINGDGYEDLVVGKEITSGTFVGEIEVYQGDGMGNYVSAVTLNDYLGLPMPRVQDVEVADMNADGRLDIVAGVNTNDASGRVIMKLNQGSYSFLDGPYATPVGYVTAIEVADMLENDQGTMDILASSLTAETVGEVELWHGTLPGGVYTLPLTRSDSFVPSGGPISLSVGRFNQDIFPDVIVGTRDSAFYTGSIYGLRAFGFLPSASAPVNSTTIGEVVTQTMEDFNRDFSPDVAVGTKTGSNTGRVVVYFNLN
jgi:prepilin-type N-terminal cleavage/methylation domain-containing protein